MRRVVLLVLIALVIGPFGSAYAQSAVAPSPEVPAYVDYTEPNDDALLAWPLRFWARQSFQLSEPNDVDYFAFELPTPTSLIVDSEDMDGLAITFEDRETGETVAEGRFAALSSGHFLMRVERQEAARDGQANFARVFSLVLRPTTATTPIEALSVDPYPGVVRPGVIKPVWAGPSDEIQYNLSADFPGLYSFNLRQLGRTYRVTLHAEGNPETKYLDHLAPGGGMVHLPAGTYVIRLSGLRPHSAMGAGEMLVRYEPSQDPFEPNDTPQDAKPLALNATTEILLEPGSSSEYFQLRPPSNGRIQIYLEGDSSCNTINLSLSSDGEPGMVETLSSPLGNFSYESETSFARGQDVLLFLRRGMSCRSSLLGVLPFDISASMLADESGNQGPATTPIYLIGVEMTGAAIPMRAAVSEIEGRFLDAADAAEIGTTLEQIITEERERESAPERVLLSPRLIFIIGGGALLVLCVISVFLFAFKRK